MVNRGTEEMKSSCLDLYDTRKTKVGKRIRWRKGHERTKKGVTFLGEEGNISFRKRKHITRLV